MLHVRSQRLPYPILRRACGGLSMWTGEDNSWLGHSVERRGGHYSPRRRAMRVPAACAPPAPNAPTIAAAPNPANGDPTAAIAPASTGAAKPPVHRQQDHSMSVSARSSLQGDGLLSLLKLLTTRYCAHGACPH